MQFVLEDGTNAFLRGIVQSSDYRRDYIKTPTNAVDEIKQIAQAHLPSTCWRGAPMLLIGFSEEDLSKLMHVKLLPPILCVGEFLSYRKRRNGSNKAVYLHIAWLQDDFLPYMNNHNEAEFRKISWDSYLLGET